MSSVLEGLTIEVKTSTQWLGVSGWLPGDLHFVGGYVEVPDRLARAGTIVGPLGLITRHVSLPQNSKSCFFDGRTGVLFPESLLLVPQAQSSGHLDRLGCTILGRIWIYHDFD